MVIIIDTDQDLATVQANVGHYAAVAAKPICASGRTAETYREYMRAAAIADAIGDIEDWQWNPEEGD